MKQSSLSMKCIKKICKCGCGTEFIVNKRWKYRGYKQKFIFGHSLNVVDRHKPISEKTRELKREIALRLGLRPPSRKGMQSPTKGIHLSFETKEKLRIANLGKKHSEKTKEKCRKIAFEKGYGLWMKGKRTSLESKIKMSNKLKGKMPKNIMREGSFGNIKRGYYHIGEKEIFFRSKWEANYALYLDFLVKQKQIKSWEYESDCFIFEKIQFGTRSYRPDFKIVNSNGSIEYHEIKGWMDSKSKTKLKRMAKYYPQVKLVLIDRRVYNEIKLKLGSLLKFY